MLGMHACDACLYTTIQVGCLVWKEAWSLPHPCGAHLAPQPHTALPPIPRFGIHGLVIDPYNEINHSRSREMSETEYVSVLMSKVKRFAQVGACLLPLREELVRSWGGGGGHGECGLCTWCPCCLQPVPSMQSAGLCVLAFVPSMHSAGLCALAFMWTAPLPGLFYAGMRLWRPGLQRLPCKRSRSRHMHPLPTSAASQRPPTSPPSRADV